MPYWVNADNKPVLSAPDAVIGFAKFYGSGGDMKKFMVVERFKDGCWDKAYARFHTEGRLLPEGLNYLNSWANRDQSVCYQLMETNFPELFELWFSRWNDLVEFELVPVD